VQAGCVKACSAARGACLSARCKWQGVGLLWRALSPAAPRVLARALECMLAHAFALSLYSAPRPTWSGRDGQTAPPSATVRPPGSDPAPPWRRLAAKTLLCLTSLDPEAAATPRAGGGPASSSETLSEGPADFTPRGATPSGGHFGRAAPAPHGGGARGGGGGGGGGRRGGRGGALARQVSASARHPVLGLLVPSGRRSSARGGDGADSPGRAVPQVPRPPPPPAHPCRLGRHSREGSASAFAVTGHERGWWACQGRCQGLLYHVQ